MNNQKNQNEVTMKKVNTMICMLALAVIMTACSGKAPTANLSVPTGEGEAVTAVELDRQGAWAVTRMHEEQTKQKAYELQIEQEKAKVAMAQAGPTVTIDSAAEMLVLERMEMGKALSAAVDKLGEVAIALANGKKPVFTGTAQPKSGFAEGVEAIGNAATKIANAPGTALITTTSGMTALGTAGIQNATGKIYTNGGDAVITDSMNRTTNKAEGSIRNTNDSVETNSASQGSSVGEGSASGSSAETSTNVGTDSVDPYYGTIAK